MLLKKKPLLPILPFLRKGEMEASLSHSTRSHGIYCFDTIKRRCERKQPIVLLFFPFSLPIPSIKATAILFSTQIGLVSTVSSMRCISSSLLLSNLPVLHTYVHPPIFTPTRSLSIFLDIKVFRFSSSILHFPPFSPISHPTLHGFFSLLQLHNMNASRRFISTSLHSTKPFIHSFHPLYHVSFLIHSRFNALCSHSFQFHEGSPAQSCSLKWHILHFWNLHCFFMEKRSRRSLIETNCSVIEIL